MMKHYLDILPKALRVAQGFGRFTMVLSFYSAKHMKKVVVC